MSQRPRRRASWMKSQSDSFGPIKQVSIAIAIGFPLLVVGVLLLAVLVVAAVGAETSLWMLGGALVILGILAAASGRII